MILFISLLGLWKGQGSIDEMDSIIQQVLRQHEAHYGALFRYMEAGRDVAEDAALVYLTLHEPEQGGIFPGVVDVMPVVRRGGVWEAALPGAFNYGLLWSELPPTLLRRMDTTPYKPTAVPALMPDVPYSFPWVDRQWGTVTRSFGEHGPGQIDFDLGGLDVTAAKDGVIVYVNDANQRNAYDAGAWWYWNTVVIEHESGEYSLYGHLLPGSVPAALKAQCDADLSRENCAVPVRAGEIIGQEGNSGYSRAPHLHLEFGQAFGIVPYPDLLDQDRDGDRGEAVYTAYIYAEQNVAFWGYTAAQVARWAFGELHQASHGPQAEVGVELVRDGAFDMGTDAWMASGQINWQVREGVMRVTRLRSSEPPDWARFYQDLGYGVAANTPLEITLRIGNDSAIRKTVSVRVLNSAGRDYGQIGCDFAIEPDTPLQTYRVRGMTRSTWANIRLEVSVNPPDGAPAALVDNMSVQVFADTDYAGDYSAECILVN